jgi:integrase
MPSRLKCWRNTSSSSAISSAGTFRAKLRSVRGAHVDLDETGLDVAVRTFHCLRHDFAGLLLAAHVPGPVASEMIGHASYAIMANIYQHVPDELQRLAADQLDNGPSSATLLSAVASTG